MSKREDYENRTEELLTPIAEVSQVEIYDVEYVKEALAAMSTNLSMRKLSHPGMLIS